MWISGTFLFLWKFSQVQKTTCVFSICQVLGQFGALILTENRIKLNVAINITPSLYANIKPEGKVATTLAEKAGNIS